MGRGGWVGKVVGCPSKGKQNGKVRPIKQGGGNKGAVVKKRPKSTSLGGGSIPGQDGETRKHIGHKKKDKTEKPFQKSIRIRLDLKKPGSTKSGRGKLGKEGKGKKRK